MSEKRPDWENTSTYNLTNDVIVLLLNADASGMTDDEIDVISRWERETFPHGYSIGNISDDIDLVKDDIFSIVSECYRVEITPLIVVE